MAATRWARNHAGPGENVVCTIANSLISIDIDKEGTWTDDDGDAVVDPTDGDGFAQVGETISYDFTVKNIRQRHALQRDRR